MRRLVDRKYILSDGEIREAVWTWLKSKDIPIPDKPEKIYVESGDLLPAHMTFCYVDDIQS